MGGGKGGKPISIVEKRQKKALEEQLKQQVKKSEQREKKSQTVLLVDDSLVSRAVKEVGNLSVVTPYTLASKLGVNISISKKVIKELVSQGKLGLVSKSRRILIATPKTSS